MFGINLGGVFSDIGKAVAGKKVTTYLKVNNQTSQSIRVNVPEGDDHDWYDSHRPNKNFRNVKIPLGRSVTEREDINATASGNMVTMYIEFESGEETSVRFDQGKATRDNGHFSEIDVGVRAVGKKAGEALGAELGPVGAGAGGYIGDKVGHEILNGLRYKPDERGSAQVSNVHIKCHTIGDNTMEVILKER